MKFQIERISAHLTKPLHFGLKFGQKGDEGVPKLVFAVDVRTEDGKTARGVASDFAMVKWFDPKNDPDKYIAAVKRIASSSVGSAKKYYNDKEFKPFAMSIDRGGEIIALHQDPNTATTKLAAQEVHALEERAVIDALSRAEKRNAVDFIRDHSDLGEIEGGRFKNVDINQILRPSDQIPSHLKFRHTVGINFPLKAEDSTTGGRYLEQEIKEHGLKRFKIKINNNVDSSLAYLQRAKDLIEAQNGSEQGDYTITLDANQAFSNTEWDKLEEFVTRYKAELPTMFANTKYIEQPFTSSALSDINADGSQVISRIEQEHGLRILIDESGDSHEAFATAIEKGIKGSSMKGCKGIMHALYDAALAISSGIDHFITAEDLTALEPSDLAQNLNFFGAMQKSKADNMGMIDDAELNGAFNTTAGEWLTDEQRQQVAKDMPHLYTYQAGTDDGQPSRLIPKMPDGAEGYSLADIKGPGLGGPNVYFDPNNLNQDMVETLAVA